MSGGAGGHHRDEPSSPAGGPALPRRDQPSASSGSEAAHRRISQTLQRDLMPVVPQLAGLSSATRYRAAEHAAEVGGDWYDAFTLSDGSVGLAVGDVMGHDIAAAAAMGQLRSMLRSYAFEGGGPCEVLDRLDRLAQAFDMDMATAVYATLQQRQGGARLTFCNAGHPPPLLRLPSGRVRQLHDGGSWLIGISLPALGSRKNAEVWLPAGSSLVLYTDGLVERPGRHLDEGIDRLSRALSGPLTDDGPEALCERALHQLDVDGPADDLALLVVRVE